MAIFTIPTLGFKFNISPIAILGLNVDFGLLFQ